MKKIFTFIMFIVSFAGFSQAVTIDATTYTPTQLVNEILINSSCSQATNVVGKTGLGIGTNPNGIGFFANTSSNPRFPFASGVVLSTGDVTKISGVNPATPNTTVLSDGDAAWAGDTDLENILSSQSGVTIHSKNASSLTFKFVPKTTSFSLDFVFASEEYGLNQCYRTDSFAFILIDDADLIPHNLAVVPSAIPNTPISVSTIRNSLYNGGGSCASANASFFGAFNGSGFGPAINFNGQTVKMTASATLIIGHTYTMKLVIADGENATDYDSAIFIGANSLNIGENLGLDYIPDNKLAGRDAICTGSLLPTLALTTPLTGTASYKWFMDSLTSLPITGQTGPSLNLNAISPAITDTHTFYIQYTQPGCATVTDDIIVQVYPKIGAVQPPNIYSSCETGATDHLFNLTKNTDYLMAGTGSLPITPLPVGTIISYYTDALTTNQIPVSDLPAYSVPHAAAVAGNGKQIWVKIESNTTHCFEIKSFFLKYLADPIANTPPADPTNLIKCERIGDDDKANFNLTTQNAAILGIQTPIDAFVIKYYTNSANAIAGNTSNIVNISNYASISRTIYVRVENVTKPNCFAITQFDIKVIQLAHVDKLNNVVVCTTTNYHLPTLTDSTAGYYSTTSLGGATGTPVNATLPITTKGIHKFFIYNPATSTACENEYSFEVTVIDIDALVPPEAANPICTSFELPNLPSYAAFVAQDLPVSGSNPAITGTISTTTTLFVRAQSTAVQPDPTECHASKSFTLTIIPFVKLEKIKYPNQLACATYHIGDNVPPDPQVTYWSAAGGPTGTGTQYVLNSPITTDNTTIYVYKKSGICTDELSFKVFITGSAVAAATPSSVSTCSAYSLPPLTVGEYHLVPGTTSPPDTALDYSTYIFPAGITTVYVYVPGQSCTYGNSFTVTLSQQALDPNDFQNVSKCDYYTLPPITHTGAYYNAPGNSSGPPSASHFLCDNTNSQGYTVITPGNNTIYFYEKGPNPCFVQKSFVVNISNTPIVDVFSDDQACNADYILPTLTKPGDFYYQPNGVDPVSGTTITAPTALGVTVKTIYVFQPGTTPGTCDGQDSFDVTFVNNKVTPINDVFACDTFTFPAINGPGAYYDAPGGPRAGASLVNVGNTITNTGTTTLTKTYYVYAEDQITTANYCTSEDPFIVTIYKKPTIDPVTDIKECDSYILPAYSSFTTTPPNAVKHYYKLAGGPNIPGGNTEVLPNSPISVNTTLYVYADTGSGSCFDEKVWNISIFPTPNISSEVTTLAGLANTTAPGKQYCEGTFTLPALTVGTYYDANTNLPLANANLPLTVDTAVYIMAENALPAKPCTIKSPTYYIDTIPAPHLVASEVVDRDACNSYTLPALTVGDYYTDISHTTLLPSLTLTSTTNVYAYAATTTTPSCSDAKMFTVTIYNVDEIPDTPSCGTYTLPFLLAPNAHYYALPNGAGPQITEVSGPPGIYNVFVYGTSPTGCHDEWPFKVTINEVPHAYTENVTALSTTICSTAGGFDLTTLNSTILGPQNPTLYTVQYYPSAGDAAANTHEILAPTSLTSPIHVKVTNNASPTCYEPNKTVTIYIIQQPVPVIDPKTGAICIDPVTTIVTPAHLESGYPDTDYDFIWTDASGNVVSTAPNYDAIIPGIYSLTVVSPGITGCDSTPVSITVFESAKPKSVTFTTSGWFTDNQTIDVTAVPYVGNGSNFLYALDGGTPQTDHIFTNVNSGAHEVTVYDANGCGSLPVPVPVQMINSPASFSPNGDNINDRWTIPGIGSDYAKLVIFDRYGRLIKETSPDNGWDGTINGQALPADDYWFRIDYYENGIPKEFKSHFSLIR